MLGMSTDVLHKCEASTHRAAGQDSPLPYRRTAVQAFVEDETKQGDTHESDRRPIVPCCTSAATSTTSRTSTSEGGLTTTTWTTAVTANSLPAECGTKMLEEQSVTHNTALADRAHTSAGQYDSQDTSSNDEDEDSAEEMEKGRHTKGNEGAGVRDVSRLSDAPAALSAISFAEGGTSARNGPPSALPIATTSTAQPITSSEANDESSPLPSCVICELGNKASRDARWASFVKPPRQQGAVIQLYSLTQLDALIDSGARYMSHGDGSSLRTTGREGGNQSDKHEVLCLQPGESVLLLLHHGERGLSDVTNRFTSELSQVRIFALNLDALPPQDYSMAEQHALSDMNGDASTPSAKRKKTEGIAQHVGGSDELNGEDKRYKSSNRSQGETNHTPTVDDDDEEEEEMLLITPHKAAMISATTVATTTTTTSALHEGLMSSGTPTRTTTSHTLDKLAVLDCSTLAKQLCTAAESVICYLNRRLRLQLPLAGTAHASSDESDESGKEREVLERNKSCSPSPALSPAPPTPSRLSSSASLSRPTPLRPTTLILWRAGGAARADYPHSPPDMHGLAALSQPVLPFDEDDVSSEDDEPHAADDEAKTTVVVSGRAFRQSLRCRGRPLAAKEIRTVEQLHSLSLWTPVYTVPHLCRTAKEKVTSHPRRVALQAAGQPSYTLLYLGASWCPPCMRFVATMPQLICEKMPENILCTLKADMDFAKPIYKALKVEIIPTFVILDNAVLCADETTTTTTSSAELLTQRLLRAEVARVQNSQLTVVATFLDKNCKPLSFEEDF